MVLYFNNPIEQFNLIQYSENLSNTNFVNFFYLIFLLVSLLTFTVINIKFNHNESINFMKFLINYRKISINHFKEIEFIPSIFQYLFELYFINFIIFYKSLLNWKNKIIFFGIFFNTILFILLSNLLGLIPYSFAITAQIFITINLALYLFISFNIIGCCIHGFKIFDLFVPKGISMLLQLILIPIEIISYIFRPISLSIRLFANIMAGHTLLKVICNFIFKFFELDFFFIFNFIPFFLLVVLFGLELFVALIQSYVFFILISLFLKDIVNLDH